jgi:hypothetical protein
LDKGFRLMERLELLWDLLSLQEAPSFLLEVAS